MKVVYNEIEAYPAQWLRNLCDANAIYPGEVIEKDIRQVKPEDVRDAQQAHFFAGIGVWPYALRLAQWPEHVHTWTGSCPCQPFSGAGKRKGVEDSRHLWPEWLRLIQQCRPSVLFGEQVASPDGRTWLGNVQADVEALGYRFAGADLCAASVGAPHKRPRLFFCAVGDSYRERLEGWASERKNHEEIRQTTERASGELCSGFTKGFWSGCDWIQGTDQKHRAVESGSFPLAARTPSTVGRLRAYGNGIVAQVAEVFVRAVKESLAL